MLHSAASADSGWAETLALSLTTRDAWGNRTSEAPYSGTCYNTSFAITAKNQVVGYPYDAAANQLGDGTHTYTYDPAQMLGGLNRILSSEAHGQFVSAAYIWIDAENRNVFYSAAGHPPLLCWRNARGEMQRIESNGLLFGVEPDSEYPVCSVPLEASDRFLLYTDGLTETENAGGEGFGERQLEWVVCNNRLQPASELSCQVLSELQSRRPAAVKQQDDITLIVVDIL